jgi:hypothetical protein
LLKMYCTNERETREIESWFRSFKFRIDNGLVANCESQYVFPNAALLEDTRNNSTEIKKKSRYRCNWRIGYLTSNIRFQFRKSISSSAG